MASLLPNAAARGTTQSMLAPVLCTSLLLMMSATTGRAMRIPEAALSSGIHAEAARQSEWMKWALSMEGNATASRGASNSFNLSAGFESYEGDFTNWQTHPGWGGFVGKHESAAEGYRIWSTASKPEGRMMFGQFQLNTQDRPNTYIHARFRGAPDSGKLSYIALKEGRCPDGANHKCDVVDITEVYGIDDRAEGTYYKQGQRQQAGPLRLSDSAALGFVDYKMWLFRGSRLIICADRAAGNCQADWNNGIPDQPMNLFVGEWDCSYIPGSKSWCGSHVDWDTFAVLESIYILSYGGRTGNAADEFKAEA